MISAGRVHSAGPGRFSCIPSPDCEPYSSLELSCCCVAQKYNPPDKLRPLVYLSTDETGPSFDFQVHILDIGLVQSEKTIAQRPTIIITLPS